MKKVNLNEIKEDPWQSPGGKYAVSFKGISEALGREPASLDLSKRHPFDLEWTRMPAGKSNFPYHAHSAQWELYLVISGNGTVRHKDGRTEVVAGDAYDVTRNLEATRGAAAVSELGATPIDYRSSDFVEEIGRLTSGRGVDVVFDGMGGPHMWRSRQALRPETLIVFLELRIGMVLRYALPRQEVVCLSVWITGAMSIPVVHCITSARRPAVTAWLPVQRGQPPHTSSCGAETRLYRCPLQVVAGQVQPR